MPKIREFLLITALLFLSHRAAWAAAEVWIEPITPYVTEPTATGNVLLSAFKVKSSAPTVYGTIWADLTGSAKGAYPGRNDADYMLQLNGATVSNTYFNIAIPQSGTYETIINAYINKDAVAEGAESITVTLRPSSNPTYWVVRPGQGTATVRIRDPGYVNVAPTVTQPAMANPSVITTGNSTSLTTLASDNTPENELTYTWSATGPAPVTFGSTNGTNAGKATSASFSVAGTYDFTATIRDLDGLDVRTNFIAVQVTLPPTAPTIVNYAAVLAGSSTGTVIALSVLAADAQGESALTYTWSSVGTTPSTPVYAINGTNAAKNVTVTISKAGTYPFLCTIRNANGLTATSTAYAFVGQSFTTCKISTGVPSTNGLQMPFVAAVADQFGLPMSSPPTLSWSVAGGGTINSAGLFQASAGTGGPYLITLTCYGNSFYSSVYKTGSRIIAVTGPSVTSVNQSASQTVSISGPAGSTTFNIIHGSLVAGGTSFSQSSPSTATYSILPNAGVAEVHFDIGGVPVNPPLPTPSINISPLIRGGTWPSSLAPGSTSTSTVTFNPPLPVGVSLRFLVSYVGTGGQAIITGNDKLMGTGGTLSVMGVTQSEPGTRMRILGIDNAGNLIVFGPSFSVCAHMADWYLVSKAPIAGSYTGIPSLNGYYGHMLLCTWTSDAPGGDRSYLDKCWYQEKIEELLRDPAYKSIPFQAQEDIRVGTKPSEEDEIAVPKSLINFGMSGWLQFAQVWTCSCDRCGVQGDFDPRGMRKSGIVEAHYTFAYGGAGGSEQRLNTQSNRVDQTAQSFSSQAALGADQFTSNIIPP